MIESFFVHKMIFWICIATLGYAYVGYPVLLWLILQFKRPAKSPARKTVNTVVEWPALTLVIPAYNEQEVIRQKLENTLALDYPADKLHILVIADGSQDQTAAIVAGFKNVQLLHTPERKGKAVAMNRAISYVHTSYVIFSDANGLLNSEAAKCLIRPFLDPKGPQYGLISGEKKLYRYSREAATQLGEGLYWRYESAIKRLENEFHMLCGAAGELIALPTALYTQLPSHIINEDFYLSMHIVRRGYKVAYESAAVSIEEASPHIQDELYRRIRIGAGGLQAVRYFYFMLNPLRYGRFAFELFSHKFLRWIIAPVALVFLLFAHTILAWQEQGIYRWLLVPHVLIYILAFLGYRWSHYALRVKLLFVPLFFLMMHYCVFAGGWQLLKKRPLSIWRKARRHIPDPGSKANTPAGQSNNFSKKA